MKSLQKIRMIVFDVDGTIADTGKPILKEVAREICELEMKGISIILASGKDTSYLAGLARGIGLSNPYLIGENGCIISEPSTFWERHLSETPIEIVHLKRDIIDKYGDKVWLQPNRIQLTVFPKDLKILSELIEYIRSKHNNTKLQMYVNIDSVDIIPVDINKGKALKIIKQITEITKRIVVVGDADNDIPMFEETEYIITIGERLKYLEKAQNFKDILHALKYIKSLIK